MLITAKRNIIFAAVSFLYFDDVATTQALFMLPDTWRKLYKPASARVIRHMIDKGIIVAFHCCGKCEDIVDDFVEIGVRIWDSAQIVNDIPAIQKKYGHKLIIEGGWDSQGLPGTLYATAEDLCEEVKRCISAYGKYKNYILFPFTFTEKGNSSLYGDDRLEPMMQTYMENMNY